MKELELYLHTTLLAIGALLPIVGPLSDAPIFLALTANLPQTQRHAMARAVARYGFLLLLGSLLIGAYVLDFFGLEIPAVQVAGGIVVCAMAWSLLEKPDATDTAPPTMEALDAVQLQRRAFYPLTMPLTVGPGSISVAITLGANPEPDVRAQVITALGHATGALVVSICVYLCYRYAEAIVAKLGAIGRTVVIRLSAFLLLCIGVQIMWNGVHALIRQI